LALIAWMSLLGLACCDVYDGGLLKPFVGPVRGADTTCGNGRLDPREACDVAIELGEAGACPGDCVTEDACQPQVLAGSACQTQCASVTITSAWNADGCCPEGVGAAEDSDCGACGDGIIGPAETCDPEGSCPTADSCTYAATCLDVRFKGDPAACDASCSLVVIVDCIDDDGCCSPGCDSNDDNDCSASCGNGAVEAGAGETCEAGAEDAPCPETCDDGLACTQDVMTGSASNCNVACTNAPIQTAVNDDGCCPMGAHALIDSDCPPVCGNQVKEGAESCDPCPSTCDDADACTSDQLAGDAVDCSVTCSHTPVTATVAGDGCCPNGANSTTDSDCSPSCGNEVIEAGEACDGGALCRSNCTRMFHASLIHRYTFDGPSTGTDSTRAVDSIGNKHGVVINDTLDGDGKITLAGGSSSGSGDHVNLPNGILKVLNSATMEAWVHWDGGANNQAIFDFGMNSAGESASSGSGTSFLFASPGGINGKLTACLNATPTADDLSASYRIEASNALSTSGIHHVVVTFEDAGASATKSLRLYLNGQLVAGAPNNVAASVAGTNNRLSNIDDRNVWLGRANYPVNHFDGVLYEFRIYNQALSLEEIQASLAAGQNPSR
jgi:hypothetical protein